MPGGLMERILERAPVLGMGVAGEGREKEEEEEEDKGLGESSTLRDLDKSQDEYLDT